MKFRDYYLRRLDEIADEVADDLESWAKEHPKLPFEDLFNGKMRVVIPFNADKIGVGILERLEQLGLRINFRDGTVSNLNDPKKRVRLGKYILSKRSPFTEEEKSWWNGQGHPLESLQKVSDANQYAVIVSRHPIDVVRMSDHDGWTSCHAPPGKSRGVNYFHCAISDAKGGGAVAYVVNKRDAEKALKSEEWDDGEIFEDDDRGVDGISPLSRVRLRLFIHKDDKYDLAVPEVRSYGRDIPGFKKTVSQWALENQQDKLNGDRPSMDDFYRMGGSYQDNVASELFNSFFGDDLDSGDADYEGEDEGSPFEQYEQEIAGLDKMYPQDHHKYAWAWASVEEGEDFAPYVNVDLYAKINIPEELLKKELPQYWDEQYRKLSDKIIDIFSDFISYRAEIEWSSYQGKVEISVRFDLECTDQYGNLMWGNPDCYREALEDAKELEEKGPKIEKRIYLTLQRLGYMDHSIHKHLERMDGSHHVFKNFIWNDNLDDDDTDVTVQMFDPQNRSYEIYIGKIPNVASPQDRKYRLSPAVPYDNQVNMFIKIFSDRLIKLAHRLLDYGQLYLWKGMRPKKLSYNIHPQIGLQKDYDGNVFMRLMFVLEPTHPSEDIDEAVQFIRLLDNNADAVLKEARQLWNNVIYPEVKKEYERRIQANQSEI